MTLVKINGEQWRLKPEKEKPQMPKSLSMIAMMASMFEYPYSARGSVGSGRSRQPAPNVDIVKEYELIQQKKSKLSRSQRDAVIHSFERRFEKVPDSPIAKNEKPDENSTQL